MVAAERVLRARLNGGTHHAAMREIPVFAQLEMRIEAPDAVIVAFKFPVGVDQADTAVFSHVVGNASDGEVSATVAQRIGAQYPPAWRAIVGHEEPDCPGTFFAGKARAKLRIGDAPGKQQPVALKSAEGLEDVGVLQKERPFFRKEHL